MTTRVLLIDLALVPGGSVISLHHLVRGLQRRFMAGTSGCQPVVLLADQNAYVQRFRELGVEVHTLPWVQGQGDRYMPQVQRARQGRLGRWMRAHPLLAEVWHAGGFWLRFFRRILPQSLHLVRFVQRQSIDLIHNNDTLGASQVGVLAGRLARRPVICHVRNFEEPQRFTHWLSRSVDAYICISEAVKQNLIRGRFHIRRCFVVPNGLDPAEFRRAGSELRERTLAGWPANTQIVGSVARLVDWKGLDIFLRALAQVHEAMSQVRGMIVGGADPSQPEYPAYLQSLARQLGLAEVVCFTGHRSDVADLLAAMDVVVHAATHPEPFGRVIIEGMAAARPVVGTAAGAVPEIIQDRVTGRLVLPGDVAAMAAAILEILRHPQEAARMGRAARRRVEECFTDQRNLEGVLRVYAEVLV